jgi:hypothetical protein
MMKNRILIEEKMHQLIKMTTGFCGTYLDTDYNQLCEKLIQKMSRKRDIPFLSGRLEIWAAAIVYVTTFRTSFAIKMLITSFSRIFPSV